MYLIIIGAGSIGSQLIKLTTEQNNDVVVIEKDPDIAETASSTYDCLVINEDATIIDTLEEAGAHQADAIISTTDEDAINIMVMLLAQELEIPSLVSVVHTPEHMRLFRQIGVNVLENPQHLIAEYLYRAVQRPSVKDFMHLGEGAEVFEITTTQGSEIAGTSLQDAHEMGLFGDDVLIVAIERDHSVITPRGETEIQVGDLVTVFSKHGFAPDVMELFTGNGRSNHR
ncbi:TrkA family potassium uptake protein [Haladaptatus sp. DYF46]|uniref:potassium channel family protein n=1 Tax=Haladaptatus sp. DYF46 TaxID=2886041 RepID=UPI001E30C6CA|nr:TrkA family potassium uptake protein [Haladaptatus sp. DYF46]